MRFLRQSLVGVFLASVTLALLIYAAQLIIDAVQTRMNSDNGSPPPRERVFAVNVVTAELQSIEPVLEAFGEVQSRRTLELRAATGGQVVMLAPEFEEGGVVETGDILVRIDPADAQAALDRVQSDMLDARAEENDAERALTLARAELDAAEDQAELRERAFNRQKDLAARGVGTATAVETAELAAASARQSVLARRIAEAQAEARVDQAATKLARAQITLSEAQRNFDDTELVARFDGALSEVSLVEGRLVQANEKLAMLVDPNALEVAFRVSTAQYSRLLDPVGRLIPSLITARLDVSGADLIATGVITRDAAAASQGQSGRLLFARLDDAPGFKPGDFVTVQVREPEISGVALLPASALDADSTVLVLDPEDRLEELKVELVRRQGDDILVRGEGLEGREVVAGRTPLLGGGIRVRPLRDAAVMDEEQAMLELSAERRAALVAFVSANTRMPEDAKARVLGQLEGDRVPAQLVERIESRMGG